MKTSWRHLEDVFRLRLQKTSSRRLQDVLIKTNMFALALRLQKTSWSRPIYSSWLYVFKTSSRRLQDVFKTSCKNVFKTSWRRLQDGTSKHSSWWRLLEDVFRLRLQKTSSRRLDQDEYIRLSHTSSEDVFKTSSRRLGQDQYIRLGYTYSRRLQDVFKTSSRRLAKISSRCFQDVSSS